MSSTPHNIPGGKFPGGSLSGTLIERLREEAKNSPTGFEVRLQKLTRKAERPVAIMRQGAYEMQRFDIE
jgi:hypothetical protein